MKIISSIVVIIILVAVVAGLIFWSRVPDMIANRLSDQMKVSVTIGSMGLGWNRVSVNKIEIGNPPKSILTKAFSCREIDVRAPFTHYLNKNIVLDEIDLQDVYLGLEFDSATSTNGNWTTIMGNMASSTPPQPKNGSGSDRSVLIHRLVLTNINVDVVYRKQGGKVQRLPTIPRMELTEISSQGGLPMDQIMHSVLGNMLKEVFIKENLKNMLQELMTPGSPANQLLNPLKKFFGELEEELIGE